MSEDFRREEASSSQRPTIVSQICQLSVKERLRPATRATCVPAPVSCFQLLCRGSHGIPEGSYFSQAPFPTNNQKIHSKVVSVVERCDFFSLSDNQGNRSVERRSGKTYGLCLNFRGWLNCSFRSRTCSVPSWPERHNSSHTGWSVLCPGGSRMPRCFPLRVWLTLPCSLTNAGPIPVL